LTPAAPLSRSVPPGGTLSANDNPGPVALGGGAAGLAKLLTDIYSFAAILLKCPPTREDCHDRKNH